MPNLNFCSFIGQAGSDPKCRTFESGSKVANVNIAVSEKYKTRDGEVKENTEWIPLVFNDKLAEVAEKYIVKGTAVTIIADGADEEEAIATLSELIDSDFSE